jgi:ABC-type transporter Mla subunit MlaD
MNRIARPELLVAGLLATAALAAGCGSDTEASNDYVDQVNELQVSLVDQVTETISGAPPTDANAATEAAGDLQEVFDSTAADLDAIEPPEDVADQHAELVDTVSQVGDEIGDAKDGFASGDPQQAVQAAQQLQSSTTDLQTQLNSLINEINSQLQG